MRGPASFAEAAVIALDALVGRDHPATRIRSGTGTVQVPHVTAGIRMRRPAGLPLPHAAAAPGPHAS